MFITSRENSCKAVKTKSTCVYLHIHLNPVDEHKVSQLTHSLKNITKFFSMYQVSPREKPG